AAPARPAAGQLLALLGAGRARAGEPPRGAELFVVAGATDQGRVAVGGEGHLVTEHARAALPAAGELFALLGPGRARAGEHPRGAAAVVGAVAAQQDGVAVVGQA